VAKGKGSAFEREFCKDLSLWWTFGEREDVFWRSSNSGGRATVRASAGKTTVGQHGDVAATDEIGIPLLNLVTIELKRGYSKSTVQDVFDKKPHAAQQQWEKFYEQTVQSSLNAGSYSWLMVHRRDQRDPLVFMPSSFYNLLNNGNCFSIEPAPIATFTAPIRLSKEESSINNHPQITMILWKDFKDGTDRFRLEKILEKLNQ